MNELRNAYHDMLNEERESRKLFSNIVQCRKWSLSDFHRISDVFVTLAASEKKLNRLISQLELYNSVSSNDGQADSLSKDINDLKTRIREEFAFLKATHGYLKESIRIMNQHENFSGTFIADLGRIEKRITTLLERISSSLNEVNSEEL